MKSDFARASFKPCLFILNVVYIIAIGNDQILNYIIYNS